MKKMTTKLFSTLFTLTATFTYAGVCTMATALTIVNVNPPVEENLSDIFFGHTGTAADPNGSILSQDKDGRSVWFYETPTADDVLIRIAANWRSTLDRQDDDFQINEVSVTINPTLKTATLVPSSAQQPDSGSSSTSIVYIGDATLYYNVVPRRHIAEDIPVDTEITQKFGILPTDDMILRQINAQLSTINADPDINQIVVDSISTNPTAGTGTAVLKPSDNSKMYVLDEETTVTFRYFVDRLDISHFVPAYIQMDYQQSITSLEVYSAVVAKYSSDIPELADIDIDGLILDEINTDEQTVYVHCKRDLGWYVGQVTIHYEWTTRFNVSDMIPERDLSWFHQTPDRRDIISRVKTIEIPLTNFTEQQYQEMFDDSQVTFDDSHNDGGSVTITPNPDCVSYYGTVVLSYLIDDRSYLPEQIINTDLANIQTYVPGYPTVDDIKAAVLLRNPTTAPNIVWNQVTFPSHTQDDATMTGTYSINVRADSPTYIPQDFDIVVTFNYHTEDAIPLEWMQTSMISNTDTSKGEATSGAEIDGIKPQYIGRLSSYKTLLIPANLPGEENTYSNDTNTETQFQEGSWARESDIIFTAPVKQITISFNIVGEFPEDSVGAYGIGLPNQVNTTPKWNWTNITTAGPMNIHETLTITNTSDISQINAAGGVALFLTSNGDKHTSVSTMDISVDAFGADIPVTKIGDHAFDGILPQGIENIDMRSASNLQEIGQYALASLPNTIARPVASPLYDALPTATTGLLLPSTPTLTRIDSFAFANTPTLNQINGVGCGTLYNALNLKYIGRDIFDNTAFINLQSAGSTATLTATANRYYIRTSDNNSTAVTALAGVWIVSTHGPLITDKTVNATNVDLTGFTSTLSFSEGCLQNATNFVKATTYNTGSCFKYICDYAFADNPNLVQVIGMPLRGNTSTLKYVGDYAFYNTKWDGTSNGTSAVSYFGQQNSSVEYYGSHVFANNLTNFTLVNKISDWGGTNENLLDNKKTMILSTNAAGGANNRGKHSYYYGAGFVSNQRSVDDLKVFAFYNDTEASLAYLPTFDRNAFSEIKDPENTYFVVRNALVYNAIITRADYDDLYLGGSSVTLKDHLVIPGTWSTLVGNS